MGRAARETGWCLGVYAPGHVMVVLQWCGGGRVHRCQMAYHLVKGLSLYEPGHEVGRQKYLEGGRQWEGEGDG